MRDADVFQANQAESSKEVKPFEVSRNDATSWAYDGHFYFIPSFSSAHVVVLRYFARFGRLPVLVGLKVCF